MNQVVLIGRLTRDPELRFLPNSGRALTKFSLAVNREFKREGQADADFFNIKVWGKSAESAANYLVKGRLVAVHGAMRNNNYEDKNGVKHYGVEVIASRVEFLEWATNSQNKNAIQNKSHNPQTYQQDTYNSTTNASYQHDFNGFQAIDSDIPF